MRTGQPTTRLPSRYMCTKRGVKTTRIRNANAKLGREGERRRTWFGCSGGASTRVCLPGKRGSKYTKEHKEEGGKRVEMCACWG